MKRLLVWISCLIVIFSLSAVCRADEPNPAIWKPLKNSFYYNKKIITKAPGIVLVWTYKTITDRARAKIIEDVKKYDPEKAVRYQDYDHETALWEIDCHAKLVRTEEFIDFDKSGKVLERYRTNPSDWVGINPKTGADHLYQKACFPQKEPPKIMKKKRR